MKKIQHHALFMANLLATVACIMGVHTIWTQPFDRLDGATFALAFTCWVILTHRAPS